MPDVSDGGQESGQPVEALLTITNEVVSEVLKTLKGI
jgi:hypothetical protein